MSDAASVGTRLFDGGPFPRWLWPEIRPSGGAGTGTRALLEVAVAWLPLAVLAVLQAAVTGSSDGALSFLRDLGAYSRFLVAAPLLLVAETVCPKRLGSVVQYFAESGMIDPRDEGRFALALTAARRLRDSRVADLLAVIAAYATVYAILTHVSPANLPAWHRTDTGAGTSLSWAGVWHLLVSLPLLLVLLLGWLWRWALWTVLLWRISRCRLRLVAAHPDRAGGLRFVSYSTRGYVPIASALGAIVAGTAANGIVNFGASPLAYKYLAPALAGTVLLLVAGPPFLFVGRMFEEWRSGAALYGALADRIGRRFERRWLGRDLEPGKDELSVPDFSAMTDLYSVVGNVYAMGLAPFDVRSLVIVVLAALVPLVPVALLAVPLETILRWLADLLF